jgi:hypothetical protein
LRPSNEKAVAKKTTGTVPVIHPQSVFGIEDARATLRLAKNCLPREIRLGRLRVSKRAGRYLILGQWLLEWIAAGELPRRKPATAARVNGTTTEPEGGDI